ncbi:MAG: glutamyl-tRNA synthetase [Actinomycetota bacterium]|nr:glutamyl-tRNA synthetase [Actinomycetota bacterium]
MAPFVARFSPAPTGYLHVGSARTALFNWLAVRHAGGELKLRVEDTNAALYKPEYLESILQTLDWLGIGFDGEPVFQSQRSTLYAESVDSLVVSGHAYYCDCSQEDVQARTKGNATPGYDGFCRERGLTAGAVRFRVPDEGTTEFDDVVRGHVSFDNAALSDFVIQRGDGSATFFLPNAIDDVDMGITHVIRGEDLINVTPNVLLIREALGVTERPVFAHLPILVNAQRKKLSKRRDDVAVEEFRTRGYLPEAFANYLAVLGWGPPDGVEIRPVEEIVEHFDLDHVVKSAAFFDVQKLDHFNGEYIRRLSPEQFTSRAAPWLGEDIAASPAWQRMAPLVQERVVTLAEALPMVDFLFGEPVIDEAAWEKVMVKGPNTTEILRRARAEYSECLWEAATLHDVTLALGEALDMKLGKAQAPIRVAVTGRTVGPPLFESLEVLGREQTLARVDRALERLGSG